jgi:xylan 1,4-beta-xylosidase
VRVPVPAGARYTVRHYRIDAGHSNIVPAWERMRGGAPWPTPDQWAELDELNTLDELRPAERAAAGGDGMLEFGFDLPMPGVSYLELVP